MAYLKDRLVKWREEARRACAMCLWKLPVVGHFGGVWLRVDEMLIDQAKAAFLTEHTFDHCAERRADAQPARNHPTK